MPRAESRRTPRLRVSRPGYGASTSTPPGLASVGRQVVELADLLGWSTFGTFGSSGGGPYALATAAVAPDRVTRVAVAAGPGPTEEEPSPEELEAGVREFADRLLPLDPAAFQAAMAADLPPNEHYFEDHPAEAPIFFADLRRALDPPDGFARDNLSWGGTWDVDLAAVTSPVDLLYGDADQMVPVANGHVPRRPRSRTPPSPSSPAPATATSPSPPPTGARPLRRLIGLVTRGYQH